MKVLLLLRPENDEVRNHFYQNAIVRFGGEVVTVRDEDSKDVFLEKLKDVDGILLPGGDVVGPWDFFLIDYAVKHQLRLLGICQGMQSMVLWKTGRDLVGIGDVEHNLEHDGYHHFVAIKKDSRLYQILGEDYIRVNSFHNFTVLDGGNFDVVAQSDDGLIEAVENPDHYFQIGVQWHPERMLELDQDLYSEKLFRVFLAK